MRSILLLFFLLSCREKPPAEVAAERLFRDGKNALIARCQGRYNMDKINRAYDDAMKVSPDSALKWSANFFADSKAGICPE